MRYGGQVKATGCRDCRTLNPRHRRVLPLFDIVVGQIAARNALFGQGPIFALWRGQIGRRLVLLRNLDKAIARQRELQVRKVTMGERSWLCVHS